MKISFHQTVKPCLELLTRMLTTMENVSERFLFRNLNFTQNLWFHVFMLKILGESQIP